MELTRPSLLALICLVLVGSDASKSGEDYWHSVWPNTPLPKIISDLLLPYSEMPIKAKEEKQYWTLFFEHDLYPGKQMSLGIHEHSEIQPFGALVWRKREEPSQPFGALVWRKREEPSQPFGARGRWTREEPSQHFRAHTQKLEKDIIDEFCGPSAIGEDKYCALSLEAMLDFAISKLGTNIKVISSSLAKNQDQYVVQEVKKIGNKAVMCHRMNFEKVLFYCHEVNATTAYMVPLVAPDGTKAEALTICHHDTRGMDPDVLYKVLKVKPGTIPVCHFVGNKAVAWVPNRDASHESSDHLCVT